MKRPSSSTTNYPTPRSAGPVEWVKDKLANMRNKRSQTGGYEQSRGVDGHDAYQNLNPRGGRGGRMDDNDPWDSRVGGRDDDPYGPGPGGYHEEAELGLEPTPGVYGGQAQDYMGGNTSYGAGGHSRGNSDLDPFSDRHQMGGPSSMRSVSPRPELGIKTSYDPTPTKKEDGNTSPISTRKSVFREDMS